MANAVRLPLTREEAHEGAISFVAAAAAQELALMARYGDSVELVKPKDRDKYDAVRQVVSALRHAAMMLRRYALGRVGISAVKSALSPVDVIYAGLSPHLTGVLGDNWGDDELADDIRACLERCAQAPAEDGVVSVGKRLDHAAAAGAGYDFAAIASERAVMLHAQHGDCLAVVEPSERARWQAITDLVRAEHDAGVTLLRFAACREPWSAVEAAVRTVDGSRCDLADVAPGAIALDSESAIDEDLANLLDSAGLQLSTF